jgi:hypothetical protein
LLELSTYSKLSFSLRLTDGTVIETVAEAAKYFSGLTVEQRARNPWKIAIRMLDVALKEPTYLKAATMSLQTAFVLEGLLASPLYAADEP